MAQEFGKIEKPLAKSFENKRIVLLVPLLSYVPDGDLLGSTILDNYWNEVNSQIMSLQTTLGSIKSVYIEYLTEDERDNSNGLDFLPKGLKAVLDSNIKDNNIVKATEDQNILAQLLDLQMIMMPSFRSKTVSSEMQNWLSRVLKQRYEYISNKIDQTLPDNQIALLFINEHHKIQFPSDVEVIFISPPSLDTYRRWLVDWMNQPRNSGEGESITGSMPEN